MIREFGSLGRQVNYDLDGFESLCIQSGTTSIFSKMVSCVCNCRQRATRHQRNKKSVVAIMYSLVFTLSQRCSFMQRENTLFMITNNLNRDAINTERNLASARSSRTGNRILTESEEKNSKIVDEAISQATENGWLIFASIDDYASIHSHRRPTSAVSSSVRNMATIVIIIFQGIPAISWNQVSDLHITQAPQAPLTNFIAGAGSMHKLKSSYTSVMPR